MASSKAEWEELHKALGFKPLNRTWAKLEIFLGLLTAALGLLLGMWAVTQAEIRIALAVGGLILFALGGYLAMAGHRSHLYQSSNELAAYLIEEIRRSKDRIETP